MEDELKFLTCTVTCAFYAHLSYITDRTDVHVVDTRSVHIHRSIFNLCLTEKKSKTVHLYSMFVF